MSQFDNSEILDKIERWNNRTAIRREEDAGQHYRNSYKGVNLDPFRIADICGITDPAMFTILKKVVRGGKAHKDLRQDLLDIINAAERKLEMMDEDDNLPSM